MQFQNICPDSIQPVRSAAHHCKNWGKDVVTVPHSNSNWQPKVLPNLNAAAAAAPSVFCCDTWSVQKRLVRSLWRWWTCTLLIPLGFFFASLMECGWSPLRKKKKINQIKGHAVLPVAKPWVAPRMSEANVVSGGKGRIHAGETGAGVGGVGVTWEMRNKEEKVKRRFANYTRRQSRLLSGLAEVWKEYSCIAVIGTRPPLLSRQGLL